MCFRTASSTHLLFQSLLSPKLLNISRVWHIFVLRCYTIWMKWETACVWSSHGGNTAWPTPASQMRTPSCTADRTIHTCISQLLIQCVYAANGAQGGRPSPHTHTHTPERPNVWQLPYFICLENSVFTTLSFVLLLKKKNPTILKHLWKYLLAITHMTRLRKNCCITLKLNMRSVKIYTDFTITFNLVHLYSGTQHWLKMTTWIFLMQRRPFHKCFNFFVSIFRELLQKLFLHLIN